MRTVICIIYVHDDVDVSAYESVNVYADGYVNVSVNRYMYVQMNMKMIMILVIVYVYVYRYLYIYTSYKMKNDFRDGKYMWKMKF